MSDTEDYTGANLTGTSGNKNRTLTLANTIKTVGGRFLVTHSGSYLYIDLDYTVVHNDTGTVITFLIKVYNDTPISVSYDVVKLSEESNLANNFSLGFKRMVDYAGKPITIKYYSMVTGSVYDDEVTLSEVTGSTVWTSGIVFPLNNKYGSEDYNLVEQGKLSLHDQRLFVNGSLDFTSTGSIFKVKIGMNGSPIQADNFTMIPIGGLPIEVGAVQIYKKVYIRKLTAGSFIGES